LYEAEVNNSTESIQTLPPEARKCFAEYRSQVTARTTLPWGEHCTECVWPTCYATCELYSPRADGACRQFADGVVRIDHPEGLSPYVVKIRFKRWAKLWTVGNIHLQSLAKAENHERLNMAVGAIGRTIPMPGRLKSRVLRKISYLRRRSAEEAQSTNGVPDCFLIECFNPNSYPINLSFTVRAKLVQARPFQSMINLPHGYTRARVPWSEISQTIGANQFFEVEIVPNGCENTVLYFGLLEFVKERQLQAQSEKKAQANKQLKCLVWDLDNTLWDGILIEDGPEKIRIRPGVVEVIKRLDERGILHSIASKNNYEDVVRVLRQHGLEEYFLYPQINWQPKSQSISEIAHQLNIGVDTLALVDDQAFERQEVATALPQVTVLDAAEFAVIPDLPQCRVPVTEESKKRRLMYGEQHQRQTALDAYQGDYLAFLKDCHMQVGIQSLDSANLKRVYELAQRTNQMNFSGNRYQESQLSEIMATAHLQTYVIDAKDRFGEYGIVGFAVVDVRTPPRLLDLMFSCRIQSKRVEHAVLSYLLKRFVDSKGVDYYANYRKTAKNAQSGKVFDEMGFEPAGENDGVLSLVFRHERAIPDEGIVQIVAQPKAFAE